ncbi:glycoside hydrolase family 3 C-terminal domain-containing protein [Chitinophagaceae bacterium LB-8]|uniref:Glycoside hydrolase family 3 C-terminal domain-containing protein n=1 Tax=Paraflavisolibacter caeni TaxID=2982496 RepID=A0A9X3B9L4_9BACT|nr:glycoside hydrolase family 3 C-terminal domain-containing protein [Paraflavisolibacter caeni]MCU7552215.1 glycoside hydrolase family 3 C-terminal domain-containing protein [Paraflavisolibacter caeni]
MRKLLCVMITCFSTLLHAQDFKQYPMWNEALPMEQRVNDLVSRLTLEEKVGQMLNAAPAIPRLGIPAYEWWNEILHGVARTPYKTTVYPQAIGMAATWDTSSLKLMARYSGLEGRAINNLAVAEGKTKDRYKGLTYWTPNINIFRDPRWGRGQETYGEDPFLTAKLGAAFVRGLQGDDPTYLLAAACAKHYAVHSGPEPTRHTDNINPDTYDLWDTYLPAFKELVVNAKVAGVMCAYNALNSQPCCANDLLMNDILRNQWKFTGYVTSDCWAIDDFVKNHKTHKDVASAAADAVFHGTDVECGTSVYRSLVDAVKRGIISETQLNVSLSRLFTIRYRLGMFDAPSKVKYAQVPASTLEAPEHKEHALKLAQQSIVLLKNQNQLLPLSKNLKRIAVVGPNADNRLAMLGNYNGFPSRIVSVLDGIRDKVGAQTEIIYEPGVNYASDILFTPDNDAAFYSYNNKQGIQASYFNNENLEGAPVYQTVVSDINFIYPEGQLPAPGVNSRHFSIRFATSFTSAKDSTYTWQMEGDEGYRIFMNDSLVLKDWNAQPGIRTFKWKAQKGKTYKMVLEYWQNEDAARIRMQKGTYQKADLGSIANRAANADVIVFVGGISPELEGEQMPVNVQGFDGGDRTTVMLPSVQTELLKQLKATGKPVVFVMLTGSAIATPWEQENIPAILNAWYGGQSGGTAVADVLFGDYNPAGRLPVTFYKSDEGLPGFKDYNMQGHTYRYFKGAVLYPFGYGLSYTSFNYAPLRMPKIATRGSSITVETEVKNSGNRDGEEVVQLYIAYLNAKGKAPIRALKGFQRIALKKGESRKIRFVLTPEQLSLVNDKGEMYQPAGALLISVGGGQPAVKLEGVSKVSWGTLMIK